jgi:hypothetical protein
MLNGQARSKAESQCPVRLNTNRICEVIVKLLILFVAWCILFLIAWPAALLALVLFPLVWLVALPFRVVGIVVAALLAFVRALLFLPARVLGHRG